MPYEEILAVKRVCKRYGDAVALDNLSVNFTEGEVSALVGPSGCGKSSLLKLCNGLLRPDSGQLRVLGQDIDYTALPQLRRKMGYAVQGTGLFPHLTARQNITLLAELDNWDQTRIEHRLRVLLTLNRLDQALLARYPHELSGGQQQRVGLCRTMMLQPQILLLDEPFAAIDPITRSDIHLQFLEAHETEPSTVLLVTHDIREALHLADHIYIMRDGHMAHRFTKQGLRSACGDQQPEAYLQRLLAEAST
ncbi:MAG: ATP-binding cassette domain-containing protein [Pseudomonadota bacterium]